MSYDHKPCQLKEKKRIQVTHFPIMVTLFKAIIIQPVIMFLGITITDLMTSPLGGRGLCGDERGVEGAGGAGH